MSNSFNSQKKPDNADSGKSPLAIGLKSKPMNLREKYRDWGILLNYAIAFFSILLAVICKQHWMVLIPIVCFLIHDIDFAYIGSKKNFKCRTYKGTVESIRAASNYISCGRGALLRAW